MKKMMRILGLILVSIIGFGSAAFGGAISKTFEIGEGTANSISHKRTFAIPCGLPVTAAVKYSRKGKPDAENDVPLTITLISPSADESEGEVVQTKQVTAKTNVQNTNLSGLASDLGCSQSWSVRIKASQGNSPVAVYGEINVSFNDSIRTLSVRGAGDINLNSGNTVEKDIYFHYQQPNNPQGVIEITGEWYHNLGLFPIRMFFELIDPNGNVVKSAAGYAQNDITQTEKLKLTYRMTQRIEGQWKLRITNSSGGHDAIRIKPIAIFKHSCP